MLSVWEVKSLAQRHLCLVLEIKNPFPCSYVQAVLCVTDNCRLGTITVSKVSDNIVLGHYLGLKEGQENK